LRRDYLSPYNDQVNFTPSVAQFAKENIVMENAFTHYGATGLSEPSIWVGGMNLHKQYVTPFAPMNALQKLLEAEKYKAFVSRDTILQTVLPEWPGLAEIDQGHATMDYDLCVSLEELGTRVTQEPKDTRMFGYTQAQNIHVSTINRQGGKPISSDNFGSFYAPYASRLKRIDACFGTFIDKLKSTGLYDTSIIILTADHGDSLGEQGRWGHAYSIYPEIMRIPMIIHVPPETRQSLYINPKALAFSTDITPSLYYLTGHKPLNRGEMFGRPLFTEMQGDQREWHHDNYLVVSSYGPVYGILDGDGRELTVFDAVNYKDYSFDLSSFLGGQEALTSSTRAAMTKLVRQKVLALDTFYGFTPPEPATK
jgi:arylsulfatase A-like enzyme